MLVLTRRRYIFGDELSYPDARRVLEALVESEDRMLPRSRVHELLHRHRTAGDLTRLRDSLIAAGRIEAYLEGGERGRRVEWWCVR
ncbi:MAG: hypothetical protein HY721_08735 [Planctomycetes bacterium]|nr:hypothetical protein [Planctomycetota bacterium]